MPVYFCTFFGLLPVGPVRHRADHKVSTPAGSYCRRMIGLRCSDDRPMFGGSPLLTLRLRGNVMVKSIPHIPFAAIYPLAVDGINLNACGDSDCGNFGVAPDFGLPSLRGRGASSRRALLASVSTSSSAALSVGAGRYNVMGTGNTSLQRVSQFLEYDRDPHGWDDGRVLVCRHQRGNGECRVSTLVLSNRHFSEERGRLASFNGILDGTTCGACRRRYLDAPEEFIFSGAQQPRPKQTSRPRDITRDRCLSRHLQR